MGSPALRDSRARCGAGATMRPTSRYCPARRLGLVLRGMTRRRHAPRCIADGKRTKEGACRPAHASSSRYTQATSGQNVHPSKVDAGNLCICIYLSPTPNEQGRMVMKDLNRFLPSGPGNHSVAWKTGMKSMSWQCLGVGIFLAISVMSATGCAKSPSQVATSPAPLPGPSDAITYPAASTPFAGVWESCAGTDAPEQCSRYVILQREKRICGTWSYFASGDSYEGRVIAEMMSPLEARRTRICGRPGSETRTDCDTGWETIDRPLRLCSGKLGDLDSRDGRCFADFESVEDATTSLQELASQPWVQACLSGKEEQSR